MNTALATSPTFEIHCFSHLYVIICFYKYVGSLCPINIVVALPNIYYDYYCPRYATCHRSWCVYFYKYLKSWLKNLTCRPKAQSFNYWMIFRSLMTFCMHWECVNLHTNIGTIICSVYTVRNTINNKIVKRIEQMKAKKRFIEFLIPDY